jgi:hypothetical protein
MGIASAQNSTSGKGLPVRQENGDYIGSIVAVNAPVRKAEVLDSGGDTDLVGPDFRGILMMKTSLNLRRKLPCATE